MSKTVCMLCLMAVFVFNLPCSAEAKKAAATGGNGRKLSSVVKVFSTMSRPNFFQPWQNFGQQQGTGSGFVIDGNLILTNAHIVANQTFIMVRKQGDPKKYIASLVAVGHECDLAVLKVNDPEFYKDMPPMVLGALPQLRDTVSVLGYPIGGDNISITEGVVSRIEPVSYSHSGKELLAIQIDAAINPGNSGGPVVDDDNNVIGISFQGLSQSQSIGYIIPVSVIKHFLNDIKDGDFDGFPEFPFLISKMESPDMRKWAKMSDEQSGVLVCSIPEHLKDKVPFKENDVILEIEGTKIANDATIPFRESEVIFFENRVWEKYIGDICKFKILRDGKVMDIEYKLAESEQLVPSRFYDRLPTYFIVGGLVFTPLTVNYLDSWNNWWANAPRRLVNYASFGQITKEYDQIVVLSSVLADESTVGYQDWSFMAVISANGVKLKNLDHLISIIEKMKSGYLVLEMESNMKLVVDIERQRKSTAQILERYRIPSDRSNDLMKQSSAPDKKADFGPFK